MVNDRWMGEEIDATGAPRISVEAVGTAPIERIELFRGMTRIHSEQIAANRPGNWLRVLFSGARVRGRGRSTLWDGRLSLSEARILASEPVAFVQNRDRFLESTESGISWSLYTAGDSRGFNLEFDGEDGEMQIQTKHAELQRENPGFSRKTCFGGSRKTRPANRSRQKLRRWTAPGRHVSSISTTMRLPG